MTPRPEWAQPTLLPAEAVELTLRVGIVGSADHCQVLFEVRNATDAVLLAMEALPHAPLARLQDAAAEYLRKGLAATQAHVVPF